MPRGRPRTSPTPVTNRAKKPRAARAPAHLAVGEALSRMAVRLERFGTRAERWPVENLATDLKEAHARVAEAAALIAQMPPDFKPLNVKTLAVGTEVGVATKYVDLYKQILDVEEPLKVTAVHGGFVSCQRPGGVMVTVPRRHVVTL